MRPEWGVGPVPEGEDVVVQVEGVEPVVGRGGVPLQVDEGCNRPPSRRWECKVVAAPRRGRAHPQDFQARRGPPEAVDLLGLPHPELPLLGGGHRREHGRQRLRRILLEDRPDLRLHGADYRPPEGRRQGLLEPLHRVQLLHLTHYRLIQHYVHSHRPTSQI